MHDVRFEQIRSHLSERTGIVIPVYLPDDVALNQGRRIIEDTVASLAREVSDPASICLSVDGSEVGRSVCRSLAEDFSVETVYAEENRGKLSAVKQGAGFLLEHSRFRYIAVVDMDGDHFANELINFIRAAEYTRSLIGQDRIMVLGRRISRHRPLGFLRGELEELADRVLLDCLHYDAAVTDQPLRLEFTTSLDAFPDFHSGFKVFTRPVAEEILLAEPRMAGVSEKAYFKHAVEAVMTVEAVKCGAVLVQVNRSTFDEQPFTTFGGLDRIELFKNKILWPCRRLKIPPAFVKQFIDNHIPSLLLGTLAPQGSSELIEMRRQVLLAMGFDRSDLDRQSSIIRSRFI
jgi:hypothetical protein